MKNSNSHAASQDSTIQCIEVLVSRSSIAKNLQWTLSVYSLENQPVSRYPAIHNCDVYHFMSFDWKRTIKQLLQDQQIPYSIIQYFTSGGIPAGVDPALNEAGVLTALDLLEEARGELQHFIARDLPASVRSRNAELVLDEKDT